MYVKYIFSMLQVNKENKLRYFQSWANMTRMCASAMCRALCRSKNLSARPDMPYVPTGHKTQDMPAQPKFYL